MKRLICTLLFTLMAPIASATPNDGIYVNQPAIIRGDLIDSGLRDLSITYMTLQELDDGTIVLLMLNPDTNDWQAYTGSPEGDGFQFVGSYNQTLYPFVLGSEEIYIEFNETGDGTITHTLIMADDYSPFFVTDPLLTTPWFPRPADNRIEIRSNEPLIKMNSFN